MSELLLELFSEEIPARMQARAAEDLQRLMTDKLHAAGLHLLEEGLVAFPGDELRWQPMRPNVGCPSYASALAVVAGHK